MCGPKEGRFSVLMAILHRVVVSNPVQDVSKDVGPMDTAPKELLQVRVEQRVASSMHCTKLRLAVPPRSFDGVGVQRWVIGIDEVQPVVDNIMWRRKLVVGLPAISDDVHSWTNMLRNDGQQDSCSMLAHLNHHAQVQSVKAHARPSRLKKYM